MLLAGKIKRHSTRRRATERSLDRWEISDLHLLLAATARRLLCHGNGRWAAKRFPGRAGEEVLLYPVTYREASFNLLSNETLPFEHHQEQPAGDSGKR
jgi:hypothetical protein